MMMAEMTMKQIIFGMYDNDDGRDDDEGDYIWDV